MIENGEVRPDGEDEAIRRVVELSLRMHKVDERPVRRGQHPKHHGLVRADFIVDPSGLPAEHRVGLFREAKTLPALVRFSNGAQRDDRNADIHGMAIKVFAVPGPKLIEAEKGAETHDFILIDNPVFFMPNAVDYAPFSLAFARGRGVEPSIVRALLFPVPGMLRFLLTLVTLFHLPRGPRGLRLLAILMKALGKKPDSPQNIRYWSTTPYALGGWAAKYAVTPDSDVAPTRCEHPDLLRHALKMDVNRRTVSLSFGVQLFVDEEATPIEDPTVEWKESASKIIEVARIVIHPQETDTPARMNFCENLSFTPWHALPEHRPIGGINRTRLPVYQAISAERHRLNGEPQVEPTLPQMEAVCPRPSAP